MWAIATADGAVTHAEVAEILDADQQSARQTMERLYRSNLIVRRRRPGPSDDMKAFEYAIAGREINDADE